MPAPPLFMAPPAPRRAGKSRSRAGARRRERRCGRPRGRRRSPRVGCARPPGSARGRRARQRPRDCGRGPGARRRRGCSVLAEGSPVRTAARLGPAAAQPRSEPAGPGTLSPAGVERNLREGAASLARAQAEEQKRSRPLTGPAPPRSLLAPPHLLGPAPPRLPRKPHPHPST